MLIIVGFEFTYLLLLIYKILFLLLFADNCFPIAILFLLLNAAYELSRSFCQQLLLI